MNDQPRTLGGRYQLGKVIGRGGMAQVRQATDSRLGREVAVKQLRLDLASDSLFQARFRREAQSAAGLNHPNIVSVYDTGEETDPSGVMVPYIVMELVEGRTLRDILREHLPILPQRALEMTQGVLDALSYSHKSGIVHRDIKPANVMLTQSGLVKVMDFGIARAVADTSATMTQTAAVIGTAQYLSPEQARGETVDARSDIYSAGCLLYELLVGRPPFQGDSPVSVAYQHVREIPVPPSHLDPVITPAMDAVVLKALAKDPDDRYQTAAAMRDDIGRLLAGRQVVATTPPVAPPAADPADPAATAVAAAETIELPSQTTMTRTQTAQRAIEPAPRHGRRWLWGLLAALIVVAAAIGAYLILNPPPAPVRQVDVPSVFGQPQQVAERILTDAGLQPKIEPVKGNNDATLNTVTGQRPTAGQRVDRGSEVVITVNVGPDKLTIPEGLVGKPVAEVQAALKTTGFGNVRTTDAQTEPADAKPNTVLALNPPEGSSLTADTQIMLTVATGRAAIPDVRDLPLADAEKALRIAGFTNLKSENQTSTSAAPNTVLTTSPPPNSVRLKSELVTIFVAQAPPTPTPPTTPPVTTPPATPDESPTPRSTP